MKKEGDVDYCLLREGNISLILDSYDDIFSDFDPRPFSEKALSDDFLNECRKASVDKPDQGIELRFLLPKSQRVLKQEVQIKKRLQNHFLKHFHVKEHELNSIRSEGIRWTVLGGCLTLLATLFYQKSGLLNGFLVVLLEPGGWFILWNGLDKIFFKSKEEKPEFEFYRKMASAKISFNSC